MGECRDSGRREAIRGFGAADDPYLEFESSRLPDTRSLDSLSCRSPPSAPNWSSGTRPHGNVCSMPSDGSVYKRFRRALSGGRLLQAERAAARWIGRFALECRRAESHDLRRALDAFDALPDPSAHQTLCRTRRNGRPIGSDAWHECTRRGRNSRGSSSRCSWATACPRTWGTAGRCK
jgi:hypothetical protein